MDKTPVKVARVKGNQGEFGTGQYEKGQDEFLKPLIDSGKVEVVCDRYGCYDTRPRRPPPPPGWHDGYRRPPPPPPPIYRRPPPPPYGWDDGYRRPPPPPIYRRPPPPPPPVYGGRNWNRHVEWCLNRYRSYNPQTNRFLSTSGYFKVCRSPYY